LLILPRAGVIYYSPRLGHFALLFCFRRQKMKPRIADRRSRRHSALLLAAAAALLPPASALATTYEWVGGTGNWGTAANTNWSPTGLPNSGDTANVTNTLGVIQTITYNYSGTAVTLNTLTMDALGGTGTGTEVMVMSANTLTAATENIGDSGSGSNGIGTFNQSGGANSIGSGDLYLGFNSTDQGFYNLSASGSLLTRPHE
jgi:hypothetical protein